MVLLNATKDLDFDVKNYISETERREKNCKRLDKTEKW